MDSIKVITNITDEWQDEWRRMRDHCRRVKTSQRQIGQVQTSEDEWETSADEWDMSAILSFMNPESPTVFISERTSIVSNNQLNNE